jgi:Zn-dependent protease
LLLGNGLDTPPGYFLAMVIIVLIAVVVHEYAHARVAFAMGDPTARDMGKMTLDPRANVNWLGFLMFVFIGFGPLGQVPVDERRMYNRRWGMLAAVAAGPFSNLLLAILFALPFLLNVISTQTLFSDLFRFQQERLLIPPLSVFLYYAVQFNVLLFIFNLLPFFPLDGWTIVAKLLPPDLAYTWARFRNESTIALYAIIFLSFAGINILGPVIIQPLTAITRALLRL